MGLFLFPLWLFFRRPDFHSKGDSSLPLFSLSLPPWQSRGSGLSPLPRVGSGRDFLFLFPLILLSPSFPLLVWVAGQAKIFFFPPPPMGKFNPSPPNPLSGASGGSFPSSPSISWACYLLCRFFFSVEEGEVGLPPSSFLSSLPPTVYIRKWVLFALNRVLTSLCCLFPRPPFRMSLQTALPSSFLLFPFPKFHYPMIVNGPFPRTEWVSSLSSDSLSP